MLPAEWEKKNLEYFADALCFDTEEQKAMEQENIRIAKQKKQRERESDEE